MQAMLPENVPFHQLSLTHCAKALDKLSNNYLYYSRLNLTP